MGLTDPELDMMLELLEDDPTEDVFADVGSALCDRKRWPEALKVLALGLAAHPDEQAAWGQLGRAALECGLHDRAVLALHYAPSDPAGHPGVARIQIVALEQVGRRDMADQLADIYLKIHPGDPVVQAAKSRIAVAGVSPSWFGFQEALSDDERLVDAAVRAARNIFVYGNEDTSEPDSVFDEDIGDLDSDIEVMQ